MTGKYIILSINGIATLLPIFLKLEYPIIILWSWSIWGLIYYEFINSVEKIYYYNLRKSSKWVLQINLLMQFMFVIVYSFLLRQERKSIIFVIILLGIQIIKILTSLEKINFNNKKYVAESKDLPTADEIIAYVKIYFGNQKVRDNYIEDRKEKIFFIQTAIEIIWGIFGIIAANLVINLTDNKIVNLFSLIIYLIGVLYFSYHLYDFTLEKYTSYFINVCGQILAFIIFNNIFELTICQDIGEWIKIYYSVFFFTPCILKINSIMQKYKK